MSGERYLMQALYSRLASDATLVGYCNGGIWTGAIPDLNDVEEVVYSGGTAVFSGNYAVTPTWIEMRPYAGALELNDAADRFQDVPVRFECISLEGWLRAINADARLDDLLAAYAPTISGWANRWKAEKLDEGRGGGRAPPPVSGPIFRAWSIWRFRYGQ